MAEYFEEFSGSITDPYDPITTFDPLYYSSGESVAAFSDAQNVGYGFSADVGSFNSYPEDFDWSFGAGGDTVDYTVNATPEVTTDNFGVVEYPSDANYSNEGRSYHTSSSARELGVQQAQPVNSYGITGALGSLVKTGAELLGRSGGGSQITPGKNAPATPNQARPPSQVQRGEANTAQVIGNETAQNTRYEGQLGNGGGGFFENIDPLVLVGAVGIGIAILWG